MDTYHLFISHSWSYQNEYERLSELLKNTGLKWKDYSVPRDNPIHTNGSDRELEEAIKNKIKPCSCVIVLAGVYASYSKWMQKEIEIAKSFEKKIIAVEKWGAEKTSKFVKDNSDTIVKWQSSSLKEAIKK